jgi:hypothetical protein
MILHLTPYYTTVDHKAIAMIPTSTYAYQQCTICGTQFLRQQWKQSQTSYTIKFQLNWRERSLPIWSTLSKHVIFKILHLFLPSCLLMTKTLCVMVNIHHTKQWSDLKLSSLSDLYLGSWMNIMNNTVFWDAKTYWQPQESLTNTNK